MKNWSFLFSFFENGGKRWVAQVTERTHMQIRFTDFDGAQLKKYVPSHDKLWYWPEKHWDTQALSNGPRLKHMVGRLGPFWPSCISIHIMRILGFWEWEPLEKTGSQMIGISSENIVKMVDLFGARLLMRCNIQRPVEWLLTFVIDCCNFDEAAKG